MAEQQDPRLAIGGNNPPPDPIGDVEDIDPRYEAIADTALYDLFRMLRRCDPMFARGDRLKGDSACIRDLWLYSMRTHIPAKIMARIAGLNPKTVVAYVRRLTLYSKLPEQERLREWLDMLDDRTEPLGGLIDSAPDAMIKVALARIKRAADQLEEPIVSPARRQTGDNARAIAAAIHADIMARREQERADYLARLPDLNANWRKFKDAPAEDMV